MAYYDLVNSLKKNYEISAWQTPTLRRCYLPEPLAERPLATEDSTSGITCTSAMQEAISEGVARFPSRSERSLTRAYWYLLKFAYCSTLRACPKDEFCQLSDGLKSLVYARWRKAFHVFGCSP
mmetsp:Transcript_42299/g.99285  ORF Transcript_42299/g.99285 Transcript_42299/m.99285 type:complete len:123 (-) Transcript_42299:2006-2374(-)